MIEVEIKFNPTQEQINALIKNANFISEEIINDVYYDSEKYELTLKDFWLRTRNNKFMLKTPAINENFQLFHSMHELTDESSIRQALNLKSEQPLEYAIEKAGYKPLYKIINTRMKYTKDDITIDIDHANYGNFSYDLCELETLVESPEQIPQAKQKLQNFATNHGIEIKPTLGKLIYLIKQTNPKHYALLQAICKKH